MSTARERKALEWASRRMKPDDWVDGCHYVRSGFAIWSKDDTCFGHCTCKEVPRTYAPFLPQPANSLARATDPVG